MANIFDMISSGDQFQQAQKAAEQGPYPAETKKAPTALDMVANIGKIDARTLPEIVSRSANAAVAYAKESTAELLSIQEQEQKAGADLVKANNILAAVEKGDVIRRNNIKNSIMPLEETQALMKRNNQILQELNTKFNSEVNAVRDAGIASEGQGFLDQIGAFISGMTKQSQAPQTAAKIKELAAISTAISNNYSAQLAALQASEQFAPAPELIEAKQLTVNAKLHFDLTKDNAQLAAQRVALGKEVFATINQATGQIQNQEEFKLRVRQANLSMAATSQQMKLTAMQIKEVQKTQSFFDSISTHVGRPINAQIFSTLPEQVRGYFTALAINGATNGAATIVLPDGSKSTAAEELTKSMGATPAERQQFISELRAYVPRAFAGTRLDNSLKYNGMLENISQEWKPNANQQMQLDQIRLRDPKKAAAQELVYRKEFAIQKLSGTTKDLDGTRYVLDPASPTNFNVVLANQGSFGQILKAKQMPQPAADIVMTAIKSTPIQTPAQLYNALIAPMTAQYGKDQAAKYIAMAAKTQLDLANSVYAPELLGLPRVDVLPAAFIVQQGTWLGSENVTIRGNLADPVFVKRVMASQSAEKTRPKLVNLASKAFEQTPFGIAGQITEKLVGQQPQPANTTAQRTQTGTIPQRP